MKRRHHLHAKILLEIASQTRDRGFDLKQVVRSSRPQNDDHFRFDDRDLSQNERSALRRFVWLRLTISRRTATVNVTDTNIFSPQPDPLDYLRQKLSGPAYEWKSLLVLIRSRS